MNITHKEFVSNGRQSEKAFYIAAKANRPMSDLGAKVTYNWQEQLN